MSEPQKYVVITVEDAQRIAVALGMHLRQERSGIFERLFGALAPLTDLERIRLRLKGDTGGAMQEVVDLLKQTDHCAACYIEGQDARCFGPAGVQQAGRRLRRLLERARGERG